MEHLSTKFEEAGNIAGEDISMIINKFEELKTFVSVEEKKEYKKATQTAAGKLVKSLVEAVKDLKEASEDASESTGDVSGDKERPTIDCPVCGDLAIAHFHYGGMCCYSCKAFFRRVVNTSKVSEVMKNGCMEESENMKCDPDGAAQWQWAQQAQWRGRAQAVRDLLSDYD